MTLRRTLALFALLAIPALVLIFSARLAFTNLILARGDTFVYFYPYWHSAAEAFRAGRFPLWNDLLFMGAPFLANSQVGLFYPFNWLAWAVTPDAPTAIKLSIILHLMWGGLGTFALLRGPLRLGTLAALTGAALFAVGGHFTAHVEQINQLQGLSWLPWLFLLLDLSQARSWRWGLLLAGALALQFFCGHTQSVFISAVGMSVAALWWSWRIKNGSPQRTQSRPIDFFARSASFVAKRFRLLIVLAVAGMMALILALPQVAPTMELSRLSNRAGGMSLNEVFSFSLHPALIGRAFLPGHDTALHNEYAATIGIAGLILALIGAWAARQEPHWQVWIVLAGLGVFLALGGWNPVYWLLGRLPGFNLFRVPARWLALWALGGSVLAAYAVQRLRDGRLPVPRRLLVGTGGVVLGLIAAAFLSPLAADQQVRGTVQPGAAALIGWIVAGGLALALLIAAPGRWSSVGLATLALVELFAAGQQMPYTHLTAPEALAAQRPAISQLLARQDETPPPGRFLSISDIFFDPGDLPDLEAIYGPQLPSDAVYDLIVATKLKDVIAPNLGMVWELPSVDGHDGGILPLGTYTDFTRLLMDDPPPDGRLRESLPAIPEQRWLDLMGVRYLITDKVGDDWYGGVFYDLGWATPLNRGESVTVGVLSDFEATALGVVYEAPDDAAGTLAQVEITGGGEQITGSVAAASPLENRPYALTVISWTTPFTPETVRLTGQGGGLTVRGAALIDERTGAFHTLTITPGGRWQLAHSGDVKIYENLDAPPRAFLVYSAEVIPDSAAALERMRQPEFDPFETVILAEGQPSEGIGGTGEATIIAHEPERVVIEVTSTTDAYLVLADAYYPGWTTTIDGEAAPIIRADVSFRAVFMPAGEHTVIMQYAPSGWPEALLVGAAGWTGLLAGIPISHLVARMKRRRIGSTAAAFTSASPPVGRS